MYDGACDSGLRVVSVLPVKGRVEKKAPLFGVYVLKNICIDNNKGASSRVETEVLPPLSVRNQDGAWTAEYEQVMATMGIPRCP